MEGNRFKRLLRRLRSKVRKRRSRRVEPTLQRPGAPPAVVDHDAVRQADPYAFESAHKRLAWMLRISAMTTVALTAVAVIEASAISTLVPLQKVELGLVRIEPSTDRVVKVDPASLVRIVPITVDTAGYDLLMDSFVRRYVRLLLEIDGVSQDDRMHEANVYSDGEFWRKFIKVRVKSIEDGIKSGLNRSVVVTSSDLVSRRGGISIYAVDFVQTDARDGKVQETRNLRAYVSVTARPRIVPPSEKYENPAGFTVLDLVLKERGN